MAPTSVSPPPLRPPKANTQKYKVALCQLLVSADKEENIARARSRIEAAADAGAMLIVMPEIWCCPYSMDTLPSYAEDIDGGASPSISMLSEVAAARNITIVGGSIPEKASGKVFNTCCVIGPDGQVLAKHRKLHLFEIDIPGDIKLNESDTFTGGQEPTVVDTDVGRIGIGICHDIRFPELAMLYRSRGAHLICYPSAFNMSTGELLWDLMQKSRAVDNQVLKFFLQHRTFVMRERLRWSSSSNCTNIKAASQLNYFFPTGSHLGPALPESSFVVIALIAVGLSNQGAAAGKSDPGAASVLARRLMRGYAAAWSWGAARVLLPLMCQAGIATTGKSDRVVAAHAWLRGCVELGCRTRAAASHGAGRDRLQCRDRGHQGGGGGALRYGDD